MDAGRFTRLSKVLAAVVGSLSAAAILVPSTRQWLTLVPGRTLPCVWNLATAGLTCTNVVELLVALLSLLLLARVIEPVYGSTEFLKLVLLTDVAASAGTFVLAYLIFIAAPAEHKGKTLYAQFSGFQGILAGLLVAVKQIMPDHEVILGGLLQVKARYFASLFVLASTAAIALLRAWPALAFLYLGAYSSWVYLRFFQQQPETTLRGDPSEDFKFSSFFPDALATPLDLLGGCCAGTFGLRHEAHAEGKPLLPKVAAALGTNSADAARRRERGAKALEERLEMKKIADAPLVESAAAMAASSLPSGPPA